MAAKELLTVLRLEDAQFKKGISDNQKAVLGFSAAAIGVGVAVVAAANAVAEYEDNMNDVAKATGVSIETFSKLNHIAKLSGVSTEELSKSMKKLIDPTAQTEQQLGQFGITLRDANGKFKDQSKVMEDLSVRYQSLQNPADKALLAITAFGEKGSKMASLLDNDFKKLSDQAEAMGMVISEKAAAAAGKFKDSTDVLEGSIFGLGKTMAESVIQWINQTGAIDAVSGAIQKVTLFWKGLDDETKDAIVSAAAAAIGVGVLAGAFALASVAFTAMSAALLANPIGLVIAALALLAAGAVYVEKKFHIFSATLEVAKAGFDEIIIAAAPAVKAVKDFFSSFDSVKMPDISFKKIFEEVGASAARGIGIALGFFRDLTAGIQETWTAAKILKDIIVNLAVAWDPGKLEESANALLDSMKKIKDLALADRWEDGERAVRRYNAALAESAKKQAEVKESAPQPANREFSNQGLDNFKGTLDKLGESTGKVSAAWGRFTAAVGAGDFSTASRNIEELAQSVNDIVQIGAKTVQPLMDIAKEATAIELERSKRSTEAKLYNLDIITRATSQFYENEIKHLTETEDAKIASLKASQDAQLGILEQGKIARLAMIDDEFAQEAAKRDAEYQARVAAEKAKFDLDTAAFLANTASKEEQQIILDEQANSWREREGQMDAEHKQSLADLAAQASLQKQTAQAEEDKKLQDAKAASDAAVQQAEADKNAALDRLQTEKTQKEKEAAKLKALFEWQGQAAALQTQKGMQSAQIAVSMATGAAQAFASLAWIPFVGPILGAAAAATILAFGATQIAMVRSQQVPPPVSLFFGEGGVTKGPSHAGGGMNTLIGGRPANVEGQEAVIDRGRTRDLFGFIDNLTSGKSQSQRGPVNLTINIPGMRNATPAFAREIMYLAAQELNTEAVA